jgi:MFS transporter, SP family, xylose:H+ symportor
LGVLVARSCNLLATMMVVLMVDRVGRKPLLIGGALVMGLSMLGLALVLQTRGDAALGLAAMCCYMAGLGASFGPIIWILLSEMYPAPVQVQATTLAVRAQWAANLLVAASFPILFADATLDAWSNGSFAFWVYGGFGLLASLVVLWFVPETRGLDTRRLEQIWRPRLQANG